MYLFRIFHRWDRWSSVDSTFDFASSTCDDAYGILFAQPLRLFVSVFFPPGGLLQLPWPKLLLDPQGFLPFCNLFFILSLWSLSGIPFAQLFCHLHLSCFSSPLCHITNSTLLFGNFAKLTLPVWQLHIAKLWSSHCPIAWTLFKQPNINHDFSATPIIQNPNIIPYQNHLQQRCMSPKVESTSRLHQTTSNTGGNNVTLHNCHQML